MGISQNLIKQFSGVCFVDPIIQFQRCLFFHKYNFFRHLKLEIVLAIPASNE